MIRSHVISAVRAACRLLPSLGLAAAVLTSTLGVPVSAVAAEPVVHDHRAPAARIKVHFNYAYILDDRDPGDGDMRFQFKLTCYQVTTSCLGQPKVEMDSYTRKYSAGTGDWQTWDVTLPNAEPTNANYDSSPEAGYPMLAGQVYELHFSMKEEDTFTGDEDMGSRILVLRQENNWGIEEGAYSTHYHLKATRETGGWGDYELDFDLLKAAGDIVPTGIRVEQTGQPGAGLNSRVCMGVRNDGPLNVGPFTVALRVDGVTQDEAASGGLLKGESTERCVAAALPTSGAHRLEAVVDEQHLMVDFDETNNIFELPYNPTPQKATTPAKAQQDLTVSAIKVNGRAPDGKDDCRDGKNDVTVVVKNSGSATTENSTVRLVVDDAQSTALDQQVGAVEAGKEREVRFEDVRLKKGEHKLTADADSKGAVAESKDDNNDRTVTATCRNAA